MKVPFLTGFELHMPQRTAGVTYSKTLLAGPRHGQSETPQTVDPWIVGAELPLFLSCISHKHPIIITLFLAYHFVFH